MAVKCVTCDLMFRNDSELNWHVRQEHMNKRPRPDPDESAPEQPTTDDAAADDKR
jgi:hypothetical protein